MFGEERGAEVRAGISLWGALGVVQVARRLVIRGVLLTTAQMISARVERIYGTEERQG
jgi:hypothetical protein